MSIQYVLDTWSPSALYAMGLISFVDFELRKYEECFDSFLYPEELYYFSSEVYAT